MLGDTPSDIFDLECHRWIVGLSDSLNQDELQILLRQIHTHCLETLESENLLPRCKEAERILLEQRFTDVIELLSYYIQAIEILRKGKAEDHQPNPLNPIHMRLYLSSAQAILHHAVYLHARLHHYGETHRFHLNHHQRTGNVSMEQKTIPDAMDQTATGIRGQHL